MYAISAVDYHNEYASAVFGPYEDENEAVAALPKAAEALAKQIVQLEIDEEIQLLGLVEIEPPQSIAIPGQRFFRAPYEKGSYLSLTVQQVLNLGAV